MTDDNWTLTREQSEFMMRYQVEASYASENWDRLRRIAASDEYKALFGDMPFDEAYDRFESMWEEC